MMKRIHRIITYIAVLATTLSCAKTVAETDTSAAKRAFEAWLQVHYPQAEKVGNGVYLLEDIAGSGAEIAQDNYIFYNYVCRNLLDSSITAYNQESVARQLREYNKLKYYGESILKYVEGGVPATFHEIVNGGNGLEKMKEGGKRTVIIPSWISGSSAVFNSEQEYIDNAASGTHYIYTLEFVRQTDNIVNEQIENIEAYLASNNIPKSDTTNCKGFYFWRNKAREAERGVEVVEGYTFPKDTTIYVEYIGRLLSGQVFDTNIKDTAIKYGLGTRTSSYSPMSVSWSADSTALKSGSSSLIKGFCRTLWNMHPFESATGVFTSSWGYGESGSQPTIPAYAPLVFEIDIVKKGE